MLVDKINLQNISRELVQLRELQNKNSLLYDKDFKSISLKDAYGIQSRAIKSINKKVIGWKLGGTNHTTRKIFKTDQLYWGPIFEGEVYLQEARCDVNHIPVLMCGEVECAFLVSQSITRDNFYDLLQKGVSSYISEVALSVEFPFTVLDDLPQMGLHALIADCCASGKVLIGKTNHFSEFNPDWFDVQVFVNDTVVASGNLGDLVTRPRDIFLDFAVKMINQGFSLEKRQWVFTGGITPCVKFNPDDKVLIASKGMEELAFICIN